MKIINTILIALLLFSVGQQPVYAELESRPGILHPKGLLWKIEKPGIAPNYLFGTMHVSDPAVVRLAPEVEQAFMGADHFVLEMLLNFKAVAYVTQVSFFNDGRTLPEIMQQEDYKKLSELVYQRFSIPESGIRSMKPWAVLMMLMMPTDDVAGGAAALDMVLYRRAVGRKLKLTGLETAQEQIAVFDSMPMEDQLWLLNRSVAEIAVADELMPEMLRAYLQRDLAGLVNIQRRFMYPDSEVDDRFMHQLLDVRNIRMVRRMRPALEQGNAFIAIGALHLPTDKGVLHLLQQQGYRVTPVY